MKYNYSMAKSAMERMLRLLKKGKHPDAASLGLSQEEYVMLVTEALREEYITGVYVSFCDSASSGNLLNTAELTEKGETRVEAGSSPFHLFRKLH